VSVIDYSGWRPDPEALVAAGVTGVARYQWIEPGERPEFNRAKAITKDEYDALLAAGLRIMLICQVDKENYRGGHAEGLRHGRLSLIHSREMGHPDARPVALAVQDSGIKAEDIPLAVEYARGFKEGRGQGPQAVYAGTNVGNACVRAGHSLWIWQAAATSWSTEPSNHVAVRQETTKSLPFDEDLYDENTVFGDDWGQHHPDTTCIFGYPDKP
jgi:hypothetical protein